MVGSFSDNGCCVECVDALVPSMEDILAAEAEKSHSDNVTLRRRKMSAAFRGSEKLVNFSKSTYYY